MKAPNADSDDADKDLAGTDLVEDDPEVGAAAASSFREVRALLRAEVVAVAAVAVVVAAADLTTLDSK